MIIALATVAVYWAAGLAPAPRRPRLSDIGSIERVGAAHADDGTVARGETSRTAGGAPSAPGWPGLQELRLPRLSGPILKIAAQLRKARSEQDLTFDRATALIRELTSLLEADPALVYDVVTLFQVLADHRVYFGAEIVANALGQTRIEAGLRSLMDVLDGLAVRQLADALQRDRLLLALIQTRPGTTGEAGPYFMCRFATIRAPVQEPYVREYLFKMLLKLADESRRGLGVGSALSRSALGFCMGSMSERDARRYLALLEQTSDPTLRQHLTFALRYARSDVVATWLARRIEGGRWDSPEELGRIVEGALNGLTARSAQVISRMLEPGKADRRDVLAVLKALPYGGSAPAEARAIATRVRRILLEENGSWAPEVRLAAAQAYTDYVLGWNLEEGSVPSVLRRILTNPGAFPADLQRRLVRGVCYLRAAETDEFVGLLADERIPLEYRVALVDALAGNSVYLLSNQRQALWWGIETHVSLPQAVIRAARRAAAAEKTAQEPNRGRHRRHGGD